MYSYQHHSKKQRNTLLRATPITESTTDLTEELIQLLSGIGYKKINANEQQRIERAGEILRKMSYEEQDDFYEKYPELADIYFHATTGQKLFGPSPGFFPGIDFAEKKNTVLELLKDPRTYLPENEPLRVLLSKMVAQVGDIWSAPQPVNWTGNPTLNEDEYRFLNQVQLNLAKHNAFLPHPQDSDINTNESERGFARASLSGLQQLRHSIRGIVNEGHILNLYNYSLAELQQNNEWKGDIYGMQFGDNALLNLQINPRQGQLSASAAILPVLGLSYFSDNMTITATGIDLLGIQSGMNWEPQTGPGKQKQALNTAKINVSGSEVVFHNLRLIWRSKTTNQSDTLAIGRLALTNVQARNLLRTVQNKNLRGYFKPLFEHLYGLQDASYWMLHAAMSVLNQLMQKRDKDNKNKETYSKDDFVNFRDMILTRFENSLGMNLEFGTLVAENIIGASIGYIGKLETGKTSVGLTGVTDTSKSENNIAINQLKTELQLLNNELAKLYRKKRRSIANKRSYPVQSLDREIKRKSDAIDEKKKQLTQTLATTEHQLSITTTEPIQLTDARLVSNLITDTLKDVLKPLELSDAEGIGNLSLPQGFMLQSTLAMQSIGCTRLEIPEFLFPKLSDTQFKVNAGKQVLTGTNAVVNNLRGKLIVDWTDVTIPDSVTKEKKSVAPLLTITHASITGGEIEVNELQLGPANQPQHLSGRVTLKGIEMDFPEAAAGKFDTFELRIASIETADVAGAKLLASAKRDADAPTLTLTENTGSRVLLSGLVLGNTVTETAGQTQTVTSLKIGSGQFEQVKVNTLQGNFTMGGFECTITDLAKTTEVNNETVKTGSGTRIAEIRLQIENIDVPEFNFADGTLQLSNMLPAKDTARPARIAKLRKQAEALRAVKTPTHDQLRQLYIAERRLADEENAAAATAAGLGVNLKQAFLHFEFTHKYFPPGEQGSGSDFMGLRVHALSVGQATLNNLQITTLKKGKSEQLFFAGHNVLDNLHIAGLNVLPSRQLRFDADGIISAGHTAIHSFVSDLLNVQNAQAGLIQFSNFTDSLGFSYAIQDFTGSYEDGKETIFGNQENAMDLSGNYTHDEATGITRFTFNTADTINIPDIFTGSLCFYSATGSLHATGVRGEVEFKTRKLANGTSQTEYVKIHQLDIDQLNAKDMFLYLPGANMTKFESKPAGITSISNIRIYGVEYYPAAAKDKQDRVAGHIETGKFDLANFSTISSYNIFTLLSGGVSGSALEAHTYSDGKFTYSISDAKLTAEELVLKGIHLRPGNKKLKELFRAGKISYEKQASTGQDGYEKYVISNAMFNDVGIAQAINFTKNDNNTGNDILVDIQKAVFCGEVKGDLIVEITDQHINIAAPDTSLSLQELKAETTDDDLYNKLFGKTDTETAKDAPDKKNKYEFLNHLVGGKVSVQIFGTDVELPMYRLENSDKPKIEANEVNPLDNGHSNDNYSTYINYNAFSSKFTKILEEKIEYFSRLNNVAGTGELIGMEVDNQYIIQSSTVYLIKTNFAILLEDTKPDKFKTQKWGNSDHPLLRNEYLRLANVVYALANLRGIDYVLGTPSEPGKAEDENAKAVRENLTQILHENMNPIVTVSNARFDFDNANDAATNKNDNIGGTAGLNIKLSLNQEERYNYYNTFNKHIVRKMLGPIAEIENLYLHKLRLGLPTDNNYFTADNITMAKMVISQDKINMKEDAMDKVYAQDKFAPVQSLYMNNLTLNNFHLKVKKKPS